ncbi:hypothetical protein BsIDN1_34440 [Bacillus safensis]|uniref:Aldehyde dehydrogenase domain-containing protein n=1 Tax=Bacillus safensis TaxID=561879 RepID=A0A5S9ME43_BACIA|nr:hypothetical protein BsIDN1_34440 [Bacillus safensis]
MAAAVVAVEEEVADDLIQKLVDESNELVIGNGINEEVFLGPVIREEHKERTLQYIQSGIEEGASLIRDGRKDHETNGKGYFVGPTIFDHVTNQMKIWQDEIFAPVLSIVRVSSSLTEAIDLSNQSKFANGACLYTDSASSIREFRENIEAGMLGVNIGVPAPMAFFPFSGWKDSFYGDLHANGTDGVEFLHKKENGHRSLYVSYMQRIMKKKNAAPAWETAFLLSSSQKVRVFIVIPARICTRNHSFYSFFISIYQHIFEIGPKPQY